MVGAGMGGAGMGGASIDGSAGMGGAGMNVASIGAPGMAGAGMGGADMNVASMGGAGMGSAGMGGASMGGAGMFGSSQTGSQSGIVKRWNPEKGFGFITPNGGGEDVFVHKSAISDGATLEQGSTVQFVAQWDSSRAKYRALSCSGSQLSMPGMSGSG